MAIFSNFSTTLALSCLLAMINSSQVQANQLACEQPKVEAKSPQFIRGIAKGELKVDNKIVPLNYAYAIATDKKWQDNSYLPNGKTLSEGFTLLLTEREVPETILANLLENKVISQKYYLENGVKGIRFAIAEKSKSYSAIFLYPPIAGSGLSTLSDGFEPSNYFQIKDKQITGGISGSAQLIQKFKYKVSFKFVLSLGKEKYLSLFSISPGFLVDLSQKEYLKKLLYKVAIRGNESKIVLNFASKGEMLSTFTILMTCDAGNWKL